MNDLLEQLPEQIEQLPLIGEYWIYQVFAVVFSALVLAYIVKRVLDHVQRRAERTRNIWDDALVDAARRPAWVMIWSMGLTLNIVVLFSLILVAGMLDDN